MLRYPVMCFFNRSLGRKLSILNMCCKFLIWLALEFSRSICGFLWVLSAHCWQGGFSVCVVTVNRSMKSSHTNFQEHLCGEVQHYHWVSAQMLNGCHKKKKKSEMFRCLKLFKLCKYSDVSYQNKKMPPCGKKDALVYPWTLWVSRVLIWKLARILKFFLSNNLTNKIKFGLQKSTAKLTLCHVFSSSSCTRGLHRSAEAKAEYFQGFYACIFPSCLLLSQQTGAGRRDPLSPGQSFGDKPLFSGCCFGVNCVARLRKQSLVSLLYSALWATVIWFAAKLEKYGKIQVFKDG